MTQYTKPTVLPAWGESAGGADVLQPTNAEIQAGWPLSNVPPSRKRFNWILKYLAQGVRYMMQMGIPVWDATEDYPVNARVMGSDGKTYKAILTSTNQNPVSAPTYWTRWGFTLAEIAAEQATPAQFDNTTKTATTAFVKRQGLQFSTYTDLAASRSLSAADIGCVLMNGGANTLTIPTPNSLGLPPGAAVLVTSYSGNCTVAFSGSTYAYGAGGLSANLIIQPGEFLILTAQTSGTAWAAGGTANMGNLASFTASKNSNGYQKLPGGLIIQWGAVSGYNTGAVGAITTWSGSFPMAFPNACLSVTLNAGEVAGTYETLEHTYSAFGWNTTTLSVGVERQQGGSSGTSDIFNVRYIAIGY